jgi:hypothetical protein
VKKVLIMVVSESEDGNEIVELDEADALECKRLLEKGREIDEWPDEVNDILDKGRKIKMPIIDTSGDNWGWK